jgi:5-oxoprolinase (ATP-hydrolysing) subunit A
MTTIDLVADIGEGFGAYTMGDDARLLKTLTSANIACGFHAGDPRTMDAAVEACVANGVAIGAHPSFPDLVGFGRRAMSLTRAEVRTDVLYQVGALAAFARARGTKISHLSPHGMLGNLVMSDPLHAAGVADAVEAYGDLTVFTLQGHLVTEARRRGLPVVVLGAIDRAHEDDGSLVSRREPGAVIHDVDEIVGRALSMVMHRQITSRSGNCIEIECQSLLLHGDNLASIEAAEKVKKALEAEGVSIAPAVGAAHVAPE